MKHVDLNLLRIFESVMQHRSVTAASQELNLTPSAVSHALARLRRTLADELFIPGENGMEPTVRAFQLAPNIHEALARIDEALRLRPFDPLTCDRTFRIAATEYGTIVALAPLIRQLVQTAPHANLRVFPSNRIDVVRQLDEGRLDLVIGWFGDLPDRVRRSTILQEHETLIVRPGHPLTQGEVTLERLFTYPFAVVDLLGGDEEVVDGYMDERGAWRRVWIERLLIDTWANGEAGSHVGRVAVSLPTYTGVLASIRNTDLVATMPERLSRMAQADNHLAILDLPYEPLEVQIEALWHQRSESDPAVQWLVGELIGLMLETPAHQPIVAGT